MVEELVAKSDTLRDAPEVLAQRDPCVGVACLREVEEGPTGQKLLHVRVAAREEASLEFTDGRFADKGGRRADLLLVAHDEDPPPPQQRRQTGHVRLARLVDHNQIKAGDLGREALRYAPRRHDPARHGVGAVVHGRRQVRPVPRRPRPVALRTPGGRHGGDEAYETGARFRGHALAQGKLGHGGDEGLHGHVALPEKALGGPRVATLRRLVPRSVLHRRPRRHGRPQTASVAGDRIQLRSSSPSSPPSPSSSTTPSAAI